MMQVSTPESCPGRSAANPLLAGLGAKIRWSALFPDIDETHFRGNLQAAGMRRETEVTVQNAVPQVHDRDTLVFVTRKHGKDDFEITIEVPKKQVPSLQGLSNVRGLSRRYPPGDEEDPSLQVGLALFRIPHPVNQLLKKRVSRRD